MAGAPGPVPVPAKPPARGTLSSQGHKQVSSLWGPKPGATWSCLGSFCAQTRVSRLRAPTCMAGMRPLPALANTVWVHRWWGAAWTPRALLMHLTGGRLLPLVRSGHVSHGTHPRAPPRPSCSQISLTHLHIPTCTCWSVCSTASPRRLSGLVLLLSRGAPATRAPCPHNPRPPLPALGGRHS